MMKCCQDVCVKKIENMKTNGDLPKYAPSIQDCQSLFGNLERWLSMVDVVFADLNLLAPTTEEMIRVQKNISALEKLWDLIRFPWTPKVHHHLFQHCLNDMKRFEELGDKVEHSIEKRHQLQVRMSI